MRDAAEGDDKVASAAEQSLSRKKKKKSAIKTFDKGPKRAGYCGSHPPLAAPGGVRVRVCNKAVRNSAPLPVGMWNRNGASAQTKIQLLLGPPRNFE